MQYKGRVRGKVIFPRISCSKLYAASLPEAGQACLGPKGLTRLAIQIFYPKRESVFTEICYGRPSSWLEQLVE